MTPAEWTSILVALIAAGLLKYATDLIKWLVNRRREKARASSTEGQAAAHVSTVDASLAVVARARDELEADNALLRATLAEERAAHASQMSDLIQRQAAERLQWGHERADLQAHIADLERRLREMLAEVENLRLRTS